MSLSSVFSSFRCYLRGWLGVSSSTEESPSSSTPLTTSSQVLIMNPMEALAEEEKLSQSSLERILPRMTIRRATSADIKALVAVESHSDESDTTWGARDFFARMDPESPCQILVADLDGAGVVAYLAYSIHPQSFCILSIVVTPKWRRVGIGASLVHSLTHLQGDQRNIVVFARDSNLQFHLFLQSIGFMCIKVERDYFTSPDSDAYKFLLSYQKVEEQDAN